MLAVVAMTAASVLGLQLRQDRAGAEQSLRVPNPGVPALPIGYHESADLLAQLPRPAAEFVDNNPIASPDEAPGQATPTPDQSTEPPDNEPTPAPGETRTPRPRKTPSPEPTPKRDPNAIAYAYTVKAGDTLSAIADSYDVSVDSILWNNIHVADANELYVGQQLQIPAVDGVIYSVTLGDTLTGIADEFSTDVTRIVGFKQNKIKNADAVPINTQILIPGGKPPAPKPVPTEVPSENPDPSSTPGPSDTPAPEPPPTEVPPSNVIPVGSAHTTDRLRLRNGSGTEHDTVAVMPANSLVEVLDAPKNGWYPLHYAGLTGWASGDFLASGAPDPSVQPQPEPSPSGWVWPIIGPITSYFGPSHPLGIDIGTNHVTGLPVVAARGGTVTFAGGNPCCSYGYYVIIDHGDGFTSRYGHFSSIGVSIGQHVDAGQFIGLSGNTGYSTGPHVHFEIRLNLVPMNPLNYLP